MKRLIITLSVLIVLTGIAVCFPQRRPSNHEKQSEQHKEQANQVAGYPFLPSEVAAAPEQDSSNAEQSEGLCDRMLDALIANWPLVAVGLLGVWAALITLGAIKRQAKSADIDVRRLNRAYLTIDVWMPEQDSPSRVGIKFRIYNPSRTAARIESIEYSIGDWSAKTSYGEPGGRMLTPREGHWFSISPEELYDSDNPDRTIFQIRGKVTYTDIFRRQRHRTFAKICKLSETTFIFDDIEGAGWNTEEEWDKDD